MQPVSFKTPAGEMVDLYIEDIRIGKFSYLGTIGVDYIYDTIDWFNKNHFDYRGLIKMELAIDATGLNIY